MRSLQNYVDIYRTIANNNNLVGDSVEMIVQLLAQASYISEVENVSYVQEASLEKAKLMNSKIQRCMDEMYSVFRGTCPRVILNIRPKSFFTFNMFDEIIKSNSFKVYYLGIYGDEEPDAYEETSGADQVAILDGFKYGTATIAPTTDENKSYKILGLIASEVSDVAWQVSKTRNYYFENINDSLSNDMWIKVSMGGSDPEYYSTTRNFSDHIMEGKIFDLTLPSFGSRLYIANVFQDGGAPENTILQARYFKYNTLSDYPKAELKKISLKGTDFVDFDDEFLVSRNLANLKEVRVKEGDEYVKVLDPESLSESVVSKGLLLIDSQNRDSVGTIHYKAMRDRYINSLLRSNSDIGNLLENMYPEKISQGGTHYRFVSTDLGDSTLNVYYAPKDTQKLLTSDEINEYIKRAAFFVNHEIVVQKGTAITAIFNINLELFQALSVDDEIKSILETYAHKFGVLLAEKTDEIKSLISKISNVKNISDFSIDYIDETGNPLNESNVYTGIDSKYFNVSCNINSVIKTINS